MPEAILHATTKNDDRNRAGEPRTLGQLRSEYPWFCIVFAALCLLYVIPIFIPRFLPFTDLPPHVSGVFTLAQYGNPAFALSDYYYVSNWFHPYMAHRLSMVFLSYLVGSAELAVKLNVVLYLVAAPCLVLLLINRLGRNPWAAIIVFPLLYNYPFAYGFLSYTLGICALLFGYLVWEKHGAKPTLHTYLLFSAVGLLIFLLHVQVFLYWLVTFPILVALRFYCHSIRKTHAFLSLLTLTPGLLLTIAYAVSSFSSSATTHGETTPHLFSLPDLYQRMRDLPWYLGFHWRTDGTTLTLLGLGLVLVAAAIAPRSAETAQPLTWRATLWRDRYGLLSLAFLVGSFVLPESVGGKIYFISARLPSIALLLLPIVFSRIIGFSHLVVKLGVTGIAIAMAMLIALQLRSFDAESREFQNVIDVIPQKARVRCQIDDPSSSATGLQPYVHFCGYVHAARGGLNGFLFRFLGIDYREPYQIDQMMLFYWQYEASKNFSFSRYGDLFDYYIVRVGQGSDIYEPGQKYGHYFERILANKKWRVYRRIRSFL